MKRILMVFALMALSAIMAAQGMPPGDNVVGKVTAVNGSTFTVAPMAGGEPVTVKIGDSTRIMKDRQPAKASDIKVDDNIFARGALNGHTMDASVVSLVNPEMMQRLGQGGMGQFNREDMGKKFIAGEVKAINELRLTIARPDNQTQEIEVDENTSFRKGRESITLADIKVGDYVRGTGDLKDGVFVPKELIAGRPNTMFMGGGPGQGRGMMAGVNPADMGKTFIAGRVKAIQNNKITVERMDNQVQDIQLDQGTQLHLGRGNTGIAPADIKVGDVLFGQGELKDGIFVPRELTVNHPRERGAGRPGNPAPPKN